MRRDARTTATRFKTTTYARALIAHHDRLAANRRLPWRPEHIVSATFTNVWVGSRYGPNRIAHERWENAARSLALVESGYADEARDQLARVEKAYERSRLGPWLDELTAGR